MSPGNAIVEGTLEYFTVLTLDPETAKFEVCHLAFDEVFDVIEMHDYLVGQTSTTSDGTLRHEGDLVVQFKFAWENLVEAPKKSWYESSNIVRPNLYGCRCANG